MQCDAMSTVKSGELFPKRIPLLNSYFRLRLVQNRLKVARYSNTYSQIPGYHVITTNNWAKHRILHVMRDADAISRVKTGNLKADVPNADIVKKINAI